MGEPFAGSTSLFGPSCNRIALARTASSHSKCFRGTISQYRVCLRIIKTNSAHSRDLFDEKGPGSSVGFVFARYAKQCLVCGCREISICCLQSEAISACKKLLIRQMQDWETIFGITQTSVLRVQYEEFIDNKPATIHTVSEFIGDECGSASIQLPQTKIQRDAKTEVWVKQFQDSSDYVPDILPLVRNEELKIPARVDFFADRGKSEIAFLPADGGFMPVAIFR